MLVAPWPLAIGPHAEWLANRRRWHSTEEILRSLPLHRARLVAPFPSVARRKWKARYASSQHYHAGRMGKAMRIDSHQHFWRYSAAEFGWIDDTMAGLRRDFLPSDLRPLLDAAGIDGCIAVQAPQTLAETSFLLDLADQHPWILGVVGWVDLQSPRVDDELSSFAPHPRLVGVRHIAQAEPDQFLVSPAFLRGIAALARYRLTYDVLIYPRQLPAAIELVSRFPQQTFVLDHGAKPDLRSGDVARWRQHIKLLAQMRNVFCKVSGLATEAPWHTWTIDTLRPAVDHLLEHFGSTRLLFGSDWPVCQCATTYARWVETVNALLRGSTAATLAAVFGGTAAAAYPRLQPPS